MNEQQQFQELFIQWLPTAVPEFKGASREQVITTINKLMESEEGKATVVKLMQAMQQQIAGKAQFQQKGGTFDREAYKQNKDKTVTTEKGNWNGFEFERKMKLGDSALGRKYAKALATEGFDESDFDFTRKFDKKEYRQRRKEGRKMGMDRFQRNAYALSELNRGETASEMPEVQMTKTPLVLGVVGDVETGTFRPTEPKEIIKAYPSADIYRAAAVQDYGRMPLRQEYHSVPSQHEVMSAHAAEGTLGEYFIPSYIKNAIKK